MSGQKVVLSGVTFTDTTLPKVRDDAILSAGSLLLFDPGHSLGGFTGVPAAAATVPNVAWKEAAAIIGSGDVISLALVAGGSTSSASKFLVERSAKGGVHGIISQSAFSGGQTVGYTLSVATAIRDYMYANLGHAYYVSLWSKLTRAAITGAAGSPAIAYQDAAASSSNYLFKTQKGLPSPTANGSRASPATDDIATAAGTARFANLVSGAIAGTGPAAGSLPRLLLGTLSDAYGFTDVNKAASRIVYRAYIEDLTVSGRSYATVDAIDYALWQTGFATGGKFYGDTYTNPSTLP